MAVPICEVCGAPEGVPHKDTCPFHGYSECRECQEELPLDDLSDGLCEECSREECEACDGTGSVPDSWGDEGPDDCDECGGDGVV